MSALAPEHNLQASYCKEGPRLHSPESVGVTCLACDDLYLLKMLDPDAGEIFWCPAHLMPLLPRSR